MKIKYSLAVLLLGVYLCAINFILFSYILKGLPNTDEPVFLGFIIFLCVFFILLASIFVFAPPRVFKLVACVFVAVSGISCYFMHAFGVYLDTDMLANALATDQREAFSYINLSLILWMIFLVIVPICFIISLKIEYKKGFLTTLYRNYGAAFVLLLLAFGIVYLNSQSIIPFFRNNPDAKRLHLPYFPLISALRIAADKITPDEPFTDITKGLSKAPLDTDAKPRILVFVLGETARAQNYSALGYAKNDTNAYTKPFVESQNAKYFDMISCGTSTLASVPCMFSHLDREHYDSRVLANTAVQLLMFFGVKTQWIGNNSGGCKAVCYFVPSEYFSKTYDGELLENIKEQIKAAKGETAIFFHLQGSHGPTYYQRYPDEFKRFLPTCDTSDLAKCDAQSIVNTYDNTILYTDFLVAEIIKELEKRSDMEGSLIYLSDHGESLGEGGIYLHGMPYAIAPDTQKHVPFLFYSTNKQKVEQIKKNTQFSQDFIFHSLLGFFDISGGVYDKNLDIFQR